MELVSNTHGSFPVIYLITDGAVENERQICDVMQSHLTSKGSICPRIYTFGIGNDFFYIVLGMVGLASYGHFPKKLASLPLSLLFLFPPFGGGSFKVWWIPFGFYFNVSACSEHVAISARI